VSGRSAAFVGLQQSRNGAGQAKPLDHAILRSAGDPADLVKLVLKALRRLHPRSGFLGQTSQRAPILAHFPRQMRRSCKPGGSLHDQPAEFRIIFVHLPLWLAGARALGFSLLFAISYLLSGME
jgi:hypothetical protein